MPARSERLENLPPYVFSVIGDRIREMSASGIDVYRLDIGNPDMPPPDNVIEALASAARKPDNHGYTGYRGKANFRKAVAQYYSDQYGVKLHPDREVLPLLGSKEGIVNLSVAYLSAGDVALLPDIGYPSYEMSTRLAGGTIKYFRLDPENGYLPRLDEISEDVLKKAKLLWVNYPNNPTGMNASVQTYRELAEICNRYDILLVSDNPYVDVTFENSEAVSALQASEDNSHIIEFMSFSKSHNMAGWRLGAAVGSAGAIENLLQVKSNIDSGHFGAIYDAGVEALKTPRSWIKERNAIYQKRRDKVMAALPDIGLTAQLSQGSLYVWARVLDMSERDYVEQALNDACVSIAPGSAYGPGGEGYVRLSVGVPDERLDAALESLKRWYAGRQ